MDEEPLAEDHYDRLKTFLLDLDIDIPNVVDLMRCSLDQQAELMDTFTPENADDSAEEVNVAFQRAVGEFLQDSRARPSTGEAMSDPLQEFGRKWELNRNAMARLRTLPHELLEEVMASFDPPPRTRDISGKLIAFVRKVTISARKRKGRDEDHVSEADEGLEPLERFERKWGLNDMAMQCLRDLPQDMLDETMRSFAPPRSTKDMSQKLLFYVKRIVRPKFASSGAALAGDEEINELDERIEQFGEKWGLDHRAMDYLRTSPPDCIEKVLATFDPPDKSGRDTSPRFMAFMKKMRREVDTVGDVRHEPQEGAAPRADDAFDDALNEFANRFGLDDRALNALRSEPDDCINEVLETFEPEPDIRNVNSYFMAFLKVVHRRMSEAPPADDLPAEGPLADFQARWSLNAAAMGKLQSLPDDLLEETMQKFNPPASTRDFSAKLIFFIEKFITANQYEESALLPEFLEKWELSDTARKKLRELSVEAQEQVIREFSPGANTRDVNGKLMSFIKSKVRKFDAEAHNRQDQHAIGPLEGFCQRWNLNEEAMEKLGALPLDVQDDIIAKFDPKDVSRDVNPLFHSFLKTFIKRDKPWEKANSSEKPWEKAIATWREKQNSSGGGHGPARGQHPLNVFAMKWGLSQEAINVLAELSIEEQDRAMAEFEPREGTRDTNGKFLAFLRSLAKSSGRPPLEAPKPWRKVGGPVEEFADKWSLNTEAVDQLRALPRHQQDEAMKGFAPGPSTRDTSGRFMSYINKVILGKRARPESSHRLSRELDDFVRRWGLDDRAVECLLGLPADKQDDVLDNFAPGANTRDPSRMFISFANSRSGEPARKRQR